MGGRWQEILGYLLLSLVGIAGRLLPHPPNFTPLEALALYGGAWSARPWIGIGLVLLVMGITDAVLGWHSLWPFTWGGMVVGVLLGRYLFRMANLWQAMAAALTQATLFFLVTNFGVWLGGWYGLTWSGLLACYVAAIPFFHYQLLGAVTYTGLFWFLYYRAFPALAGKSLSPRQS
jgi:hypothetical protein